MSQKSIVIVLLCSILLISACILTPASKDFHAESFDVHVDVQPENELIITETVRFRFEGGPFTYVYRELSFSNLDNIDILNSSMDGREFQPGSGAGKVEITSERPLKVTWHFPPTTDATHTFVLVYRVQGAIRKLTGDTIIWRAIPEEHAYPILRSEITLLYPQSVNLLDAPYLDRYYNTAMSENIYRLTTTDIDKDTGVTLTAQFEAGSLISSPPYWQARQQQRNDSLLKAMPYGIFSAIACLFLGSLGIYLYALRNQREVLPAISSPTNILPNETPPALVGKLLGQGFFFPATLFDLARRGVVELQETSDSQKQHPSFVLEYKVHDSPLRPHEHTLLDALYKGDENRIEVPDIGMSLVCHAKELDTSLEKEFLLTGWIDSQRKSQKSRLTMFWTVVLLLSVTISVVTAILSTRLLDSTSSFLTLAVIFFGISSSGTILSIIGSIYTGFFSILTQTGEEQVAHWKNFQNYLKRITKGKETELHPGLFDLYLPYAIVLGMGQKWISYFQKLGGVSIPNWLKVSFGNDDNFGSMMAVMSSFQVSSDSSS